MLERLKKINPGQDKTISRSWWVVKWYFSGFFQAENMVDFDRL